MNLLALIFIIEADNLVTVLVVSANQQQEANHLIEVAKRNNVGIGQAEIKRDAVLISVLMFFVCFKIDLLTEIYSCDLAITFSYMFNTFGQTAFMIYKFVGNLVFGGKPKKLVRAVLVFLWMYIGGMVMSLMDLISLFTMNRFAFFEHPPVPIIAFIISSVCVVFRPRKMLEDSYVNSWKNKVINVVMTLAWLAVQGWAWQRSFFKSTI